MLNDKVINNLNNLEIKDFLIKSNTIICQNINNKKQLFTNLANISKDTFNITNKDFIEFLYKKESSENSGIGNGVAIPNIQNTKIDYLSSIFIKLSKPINYEAVDKEPVDLIFLLLSPNNIKSHHLKLLALISRKLSKKEIRRNIRGTSNIESIYSILTM